MRIAGGERDGNQETSRRVLIENSDVVHYVWTRPREGVGREAPRNVASNRRAENAARHSVEGRWLPLRGDTLKLMTVQIVLRRLSPANCTHDRRPLGSAYAEWDTRSFEQAQSASVRRPHPFGLCTVIRHENHTKQHERRVVSWLVGGNVERWNTTLRGRSRRIGVESSIPVGCPD